MRLNGFAQNVVISVFQKSEKLLLWGNETLFRNKQMKWYNAILMTLCIGIGCFLWGLKTCPKSEIKAAASQKNTDKMKLDAALIVIDYYKGKFFLDNPQEDIYAFAKLKDYPVPIEAQKQLEKVDEAYLQYMQEKGELARMKEKELERITELERLKEEQSKAWDKVGEVRKIVAKSEKPLDSRKWK